MENRGHCKTANWRKGFLAAALSILAFGGVQPANAAPWQAQAKQEAEALVGAHGDYGLGIAPHKSWHMVFDPAKVRNVTQVGGGAKLDQKKMKKRRQVLADLACAEAEEPEQVQGLPFPVQRSTRLLGITIDDYLRSTDDELKWPPHPGPWQWPKKWEERRAEDYYADVGTAARQAQDYAERAADRCVTKACTDETEEECLHKRGTFNAALMDYKSGKNQLDFLNVEDPRELARLHEQARRDAPAKFLATVEPHLGVYTSGTIKPSDSSTCDRWCAKEAREQALVDCMARVNWPRRQHQAAEMATAFRSVAWRKKPVNALFGNREGEGQEAEVADDADRVTDDPEDANDANDANDTDTPEVAEEVADDADPAQEVKRAVLAVWRSLPAERTVSDTTTGDEFYGEGEGEEEMDTDDTARAKDTDDTTDELVAREDILWVVDRSARPEAQPDNKTLAV